MTHAGSFPQGRRATLPASLIVEKRPSVTPFPKSLRPRSTTSPSGLDRRSLPARFERRSSDASERSWSSTLGERSIDLGRYSSEGSPSPHRSAIKVCVRVRPFSEREVAMSDPGCVNVSSTATIEINDTSHSEAKEFTFDRTYQSMDEDLPDFATQETLMEEVGEELVQNTLEGYNTCLFAYGQTGSGKTHSILGTEEDPSERGLLPRVVESIFDFIESAQSEDDQTKYSCIASYFQIYNEQIRDLLTPPDYSRSLDVRYNPKVGVFIPELVYQPVFKKGEVFGLIKFGARTRIVAATSMNDTSSRSHCIFCLEVEKQVQQDGNTTQVRSKLNVVDLAGSERQKKVRTHGKEQREGAMINQSLSNLALVTKKLAEACESRSPKKTADFVPFRNSKLTFVLMDSLSGNSKTCMIAAISPALDNFEESLSTLRFAERVKVIKMVATRNVAESQSTLISNLLSEIAELRSNNAEQSELAGMQGLVDRFGRNLEDQLVLAKNLEERRQDWLQNHGLTLSDMRETLELESTTPQLVNISTDPALDKCLVYFLQRGVSMSVGSAEGNHVRLSGVGMKPHMASILNKDDIVVMVTDIEGRILVNGQQIHEEFQLRHDHRIIFGFAFCFRAVIPKAFMGEVADRRISVNFAYLETRRNSQGSYNSDEEQDCGCYAYVKEIRNRFGQTQAQAFLNEFRRLSEHVDEANQITSEVRPTDRYKYCIEVISDVSHFQEEVPTCVVRLKRFEKGVQRLRNFIRRKIMKHNPIEELALRLTRSDAWLKRQPFVTVAIYDTEAFKDVLDHLREVVEVFHAEGSLAQDFFKTGSDPWMETNLSHVHRTMEEYENLLRSSEARAEVLGHQMEDMTTELEQSHTKIEELELQVKLLQEGMGVPNGSPTPRKKSQRRLVSFQKQLKADGEKLGNAAKKAMDLLQGLEATKRHLEEKATTKVLCSQTTDVASEHQPQPSARENHSLSVQSVQDSLEDASMLDAATSPKRIEGDHGCDTILIEGEQSSASAAFWKDIIAPSPANAPHEGRANHTKARQAFDCSIGERPPNMEPIEVKASLVHSQNNSIEADSITTFGDH